LQNEKCKVGVLLKDKAKTDFARGLRRRQTEAEKALWMRLRSRQFEGLKFRRQQPIGAYIVDFVSFSKRLVVEVDGGQHGESETRARDEERTEWLGEKGYRVLRFWDNDVLKNIEGVMERIREVTLTLASPVEGEEKHIFPPLEGGIKGRGNEV
jgi:very-short-patch-repair endonuclease